MLQRSSDSKIRSDKSIAGVVLAAAVILALLVFACGRILQSSQPQSPPVSEGR